VERAGRSRVRIPVRARDFPLPQNVQTGPGAHSASYSVDTRLLSRWVNRPGRKLGHSRPSSAEVKNEWSYTSTPPLRLHGVHRGRLNLFFYRLHEPDKRGKQINRGTLLQKYEICLVYRFEPRPLAKQCTFMCQFNDAIKLYSGDHLFYNAG
jgi:hypothetical protein